LVYEVERYVHLARYEPANAANRTDPLISGYNCDRPWPTLVVFRRNVPDDVRGLED
jgi:hypothetical protein